MSLVYPRVWLMRLQAEYPQWRLWLDELPRIVGKLVHDWGLQLGPWLSRDVDHAVWRVGVGSGDGVLKISRPGRTVVDEARSLANYLAFDAPAVIPLRVSGDGRALLTRFHANESLPEWSAPRLAELLRSISLDPPPGSPTLRGRLSEYDGQARFTGHEDLWRLIESALPSLLVEPEIMLHGRLRGEHLLASGRTVTVVAPSGLSGPRAYDCASVGWGYRHAEYPWSHSGLAEIASESGVERARVDAWAAIQLAIEAIDGIVPRGWLSRPEVHSSLSRFA